MNIKKIIDDLARRKKRSKKATPGAFGKVKNYPLPRSVKRIQFVTVKRMLKKAYGKNGI